MQVELLDSTSRMLRKWSSACETMVSLFSSPLVQAEASFTHAETSGRNLMDLVSKWRMLKEKKNTVYI